MGNSQAVEQILDLVGEHGALLARIAARLGSDGVRLDQRALLTPKQAADYLGVGLTTLGELRKQGRIDLAPVLSARRYTRASLDAYVEEQREAEQRSMVRPRRRRSA